LSFVPDTEQRLWRNTHTQQSINWTRDKVRLQNQAGGTAGRSAYQIIQVWSRICWGSSARPYAACASGRERPDPAAVAALAHQCLRASPAELRDALGACPDLKPGLP